MSARAISVIPPGKRELKRPGPRLDSVPEQPVSAETVGIIAPSTGTRHGGGAADRRSRRPRHGALAGRACNAFGSARGSSERTAAGVVDPPQLRRSRRAWCPPHSGDRAIAPARTRPLVGESDGARGHRRPYGCRSISVSRGRSGQAGAGRNVNVRGAPTGSEHRRVNPRAKSPSEALGSPAVLEPAADRRRARGTPEAAPRDRPLAEKHTRRARQMPRPAAAGEAPQVPRGRE